MTEEQMKRSKANSQAYDGMDDITRNIYMELHLQTYVRKMIIKEKARRNENRNKNERS